MAEKEFKTENRLRDQDHAEYRNAGVNVGLAIAALKLAEPYLKDGYHKLKGKKEK